MIDLIDNTNVPFKDKGDKLNAKEVNSINDAVNNCVNVINSALSNFCDVNAESNDFNPMSLNKAIELVPENRRNTGMKIKYIDNLNGVSEYFFTGADTDDDTWNDINNWTTGLNIIDGGVW